MADTPEERREAEQLATHLSTWAPHCGAPRSVYEGQLNVLLAAVRASAEARGAAREREAIRPTLETIADMNRTCDNWEIVKLAPKLAREALEAIRSRSEATK